MICGVCFVIQRNLLIVPDVWNVFFAGKRNESPLDIIKVRMVREVYCTQSGCMVKAPVWC